MVVGTGETILQKGEGVINWFRWGAWILMHVLWWSGYVICYVILALVNGHIGMSVLHVTMLGYIHCKSIVTGGTVGYFLLWMP